MNEALTIIAFRIVLAAQCGCATATKAPTAAVQPKLHVYPAEIALTTARDRKRSLCKWSIPMALRVM